jgi:DNA-binding NarL/FixJ family response regulator
MQNGASRRRIVLADDHPVVLAGLKALLATAEDLTLVGEASSGLGALKVIREEAPDIAVVDVSMPELNGIALARRLAAEGSPTSVVLLTWHEGHSYVRQALQAGVRGYVLKRSDGGTLLMAIRSVQAGGVFLDAKLARYVLDGRAPHRGPHRQPEAEGVAMHMTEREADVLKLSALGHTMKEIAVTLGLGVKSVETYKARACEKVGLKSRADIVRYASAEGWLVDL